MMLTLEQAKKVYDGLSIGYRKEVASRLQFNKKNPKILENTVEQKKFKVQMVIEVEITAANEGEASFIADDTFKKIEGVTDLSISKVEEENSTKDFNI